MRLRRKPDSGHGLLFVPMPEHSTRGLEATYFLRAGVDGAQSQLIDWWI